METRQITEKILEHGERLSEHDSDIRTLFNQQKNIQALAKSTQELALSVRELTGKVNNVDERLEVIEQDKRQKGFEIWKAVIPTIIVGVASFVVARLLG